MRYLSRFITLAMLLAAVPAYSQISLDKPAERNNEVPDVPNPLDLKSKWPEYFKGDESALSRNIPAFIQSLKRIVADSSQELQEKIKPLASKIETNLMAYAAAVSEPLPKPPPLAPLKQRYRVEDIVSLNREINNLAIIVESEESDLQERGNRIASGQEKYTSLLNEYRESEPLSQARLIRGLQLIDFRISLELAKARQELLSKSIKANKEHLNQMRKELEEAKKRLFSDSDELKEVEAQYDRAKETWSTEKKELKEEEVNALLGIDFSQKGETAKLQNQLLNQQLTLASIEEAIAHARLIFFEMELEYVQYLNFPQRPEREDLEEKSKEWANSILQLEQNIDEWELSTRRDIQRAEEWLSLKIDPKNDKSLEILDLQRKILQTAEASLVRLINLKTEVESNKFLFDLVGKVVDEGKVGFARLWHQVWTFVFDALKAPWTWVSQPLFTVGETLITASSIVQFIVILIITIWIARLLGTTLHRYAKVRKDVKLSLLYRINRLFQYMIIAIGILVALSVIGFDFSNFVLIAGALGVGLGFGLQTIFNNFVSGIVILFENQLKVGDYVELESGVCGEVREINVRSTYIKTNDGIAIMVPNSEFTTARVINWTHKEPYRRVHIPFSVSYDSDKELVKKVVKEAVMNAPITLKKSWAPEPRVFMTDFGPSSIDFKVSLWVDDNATKRPSYTKSMYLWIIHEALITNGIKIPYPQLDLHIENILDKKNLDDLKKSLS